MTRMTILKMGQRFIIQRVGDDDEIQPARLVIKQSFVEQIRTPVTWYTLGLVTGVLFGFFQWYRW
jgi:hypothetical protein